MAYQVISRKYRPLGFADLTGQEHISRTLKNAIENARLHHAYLFSGVRGTGKTTTARILAKCLNCAVGITANPCLQCSSCTEIAAGTSLDVIEIDAASNTGVDNVREVIVNNISIAPARDKYKVFIIDEVHMLSTPAFNALLKTLEEPPAHVVFIMATTEHHKVPDTILSRCQQFEFRQIPVDKIFQRLREIADLEKINITDSALKEIARAGNGSMRDAQSAFDQVITFSGSEIAEADVTGSLGLVSSAVLIRALKAIADANSSEILRIAGEIDEVGQDLRVFARELMSWVRNLLFVKSGMPADSLDGVSEGDAASLGELAGRFSEEDLVRFFHLLTETEKEIKDSMQPRFQLEMGLLKIVHAGRLRSIEEIINRLEALSGGRVPSGSAPPSPAPRSPVTPRTEPSTPPGRQASAAAPAPATVPATVPAPAPAASPIEEPEGFSDSFGSGDDEYYDEQPVVRRTEMVARPGGEVVAIRKALESKKKTFAAIALEEAKVTYADGVLTAVFSQENAYSKRLTDSADLFRELGLELFGQPMKLSIRFSGEVLVTPASEEKKEKEKAIEAAKLNPAAKILLAALRGEVVDVRAPGNAAELQ